MAARAHRQVGKRVGRYSEAACTIKGFSMATLGRPSGIGRKAPVCGGVRGCKEHRAGMARRYCVISVITGGACIGHHATIDNPIGMMLRGCHVAERVCDGWLAQEALS